MGAGIVLQPSGMAALAALGLLAPIAARGAVLHELHCETPKRRAVVHLEYAGQAHGPHDLVVIADGARTERRDDALLRKSVKKYPWRSGSWPATRRARSTAGFTRW